MRLVVLAVSIHGSFSGPSLRFLADLGRRAGGGVPVTLLDCASWAVPRFAPFIRMAVAHAVRRGLAEVGPGTYFSKFVSKTDPSGDFRFREISFENKRARQLGG